MSDYPWFAKYPASVPHEVDLTKYSSLVDLAEKSFDKYGSMTAFINMGKSITFTELDHLSQQFASYLQHGLGLQKGDRIAIQMPNLLQNPVALFGALRAGLVVVNTNPLYTPDEMKHQFNDSGARAIVILENFGHNLQSILKDTSIEHVIVTKIGDMLGGLKGSIVNFVVKNVKKMVPVYELPGAIPFKRALQEGARQPMDRVDTSGDDLAFLQYTGGTTGVSKGAMLSHGNVTANLLQVESWMACGDLKEGEEVYITALPIYHIFALVINLLGSVSYGAKNVLITNPRDMKAFIKDLGKYPFTVITGVNTLFNGLLHQDDFHKLDFSTLKFGLGGGMAVQQAVAERWEQVTGAPLSEGYGLTEASPVLTTNPLDGTGRLGTIGLPIPGTVVKLVDDLGNEVPVGEPGELCAKGPQIMKGYWQREEETQKVMLDDWLKTGDIATMSEDGFFKIVDRKKEMILVSGFNVYPNEIEDAIAKLDKVQEVGVIGVPDAKSTEAVKAYIVKKDPSLTDEEVKTHCKDHLAGYKCPKHVAFADELPKSNVGKILRRLIKEKDLAENTYDA